MAKNDSMMKTIAFWAKSIPQIRKVWIFGSRAKGTDHAESDIDVAVELDLTIVNDADTFWMFEMEAMRLLLQTRLPCQVDLQLYRPGSKDFVVAYVEEKSVVLYEKSIPLIDEGHERLSTGEFD